MKTKNILDYITDRGCSIKTEKYIVEDGIQYVIGEPSRVAYTNSMSGRADLERDYPDYYNALVMTVWGDTPTVIDEEE